MRIEDREVIAACDACGIGYLWVQEKDGPVCLCGRGRIWFLPTPEPDAPNTQQNRERRRITVVKTRLAERPVVYVEPSDCHV
jgi:hypothetical protein